MTKNPNSSEAEKAHEKFVRWQEIALQQLGHVIYIMLVLAVALLGLMFDSVSESKFGNSQVALFVSVIFGIFATLSRTCDFRHTRRIAYLRWQKVVNHESIQEDEITKLEKCTDKLGKWTWRLLWVQAVSFGIGLFCLVFRGF